MSKASFRVAFDGEALAEHTMNVRDLAPALMGLGDAFVEANKILHGEKTAVEVHVTPQIEENCFDIGIEVLQYWGAIKEFLRQSDTSAAKELVDWLLLNKEIAGGAVVGVLYLYRKIRGRRPTNVIRLKDSNGNPLRRLQFQGMPDIIVDEKTYELYNSDKLRRYLARVLQPLRQKEGIESFNAYEKGNAASGMRLNKDEAREIDFSLPEPVAIEDVEPGKEPVEAVLRVYSPVYDPKATRWRFWHGGKHHYMDVSESNIGGIVDQYGGVLVDDRFRVMLQIDVAEQEGAESDKISYKVLDVLEFYPAQRQAEMLAQRQAEMFNNDRKTDDPEASADNGKD